MFNIVLLLLCIRCGYTFLLRYTPEVQISEGRLRGFRGTDGLNRYYGIPFAVSERLQAPQPPRKWSGVFDAIRQFESCPQTLIFLQIGNEDCLKLDIYTPEHASIGQKLPVLIFFHGGGYFFGAKWNYSPEFLVQKKVIVVLINYRLGPLGFLCLNNVANLGLKDQVAALQWIQKNIAAFGGDPDNVTLSGQSAGASSISMHILSKRSSGLFHKAILMSGNLFNPWAFNLNPQTPAYKDAAQFKRVHHEKDVYNAFLKSSLTDVLTSSQDVLNNLNYFKYSPCYDANLTDAFFHDTPYNIIKTGSFSKVPMIIGITDLEGLLFYSLNSKKSLDQLDNTFSERLPSTFSWCSSEDQKRIADEIRSNYFGNQRISSQTMTKNVIDMYSDWNEYAVTNAYSKLIAKYSDKPVYNYMFSYTGGRNLASLFFNSFGIQGTTHTDDLFYIFNPGGFTLGANIMDKLMIDRFSTMFTNFIKFGDPTPSETSLIPVRWPAITANRSRLMKIDHPLSVIDTPAHIQSDFYRRLLCEYGQSGFVPCESAMRCNLNK